MEVCIKAFRRDTEKDPRDAGAPQNGVESEILFSVVSSIHSLVNDVFFP